MRMPRAMILVAGLLLAGCSGDGAPPELRSLQPPGEGPDEFSVLPSKPLETPDSYSSLPTPTPGQGNRTDQDPVADAVASLGGRRSALREGGPVPQSDSALVQHATRNGVPGNIRQTVAAEDEEFRRRRGRFTAIKIANTDRYKQAYKPQILDPYAALQKYRRLGVETPSAPPGGG
ncbi:MULTISPECIES: DUF3035 domain-containing protein [Sediminimonas]|uniref:DUF3035 domain-containing protein n=1 Tax=Sediminimonas qiaohouensis TaxID=552061 RepID=A0A7C9L898_9RHOB|nr:MULTISPECIES: DUF3035 domain-containing protein [Sediminimonas]MDR9484336.1 DUF3035 domain-containing protein [Sediminimonas sp.]MTJ05075.1 DUF3035 domain-containing protein [Sediminimonas qiaohouensis]